MERELKKYHTCVDPALAILKVVRHPDQISQYPFPLKKTIIVMHMRLDVLKMFFWGLGFSEEHLETDLMLKFTFMVEKFRRTAEDFRLQFESASEGEKITNWKAMSYHLRTVIQEYVLQAREICILLLDGTYKCKYSFKLKGASPQEYGLETLDFIRLIQENLGNLILNIHLFSHVLKPQILKPRIGFIQRKLGLFAEFVSALNLWRHRYMGTDELIYHIQTWASHISCIACLYLTDRTNDSLTSTNANMLSDLMQKIMSYNPGTPALFLDVFKATKYHKLQGKWHPQLLPKYIDFVLEHVVVQHVNNDIELLHEGLLFLLSFVMDSPNADSKETELILAEIYAIVSELQSVGYISEANQLSYFLHKIDGVKAKVRELYFVTPLSSQFDSPLNNALGFLDSLLETLQHMLERGVHFIPSVKNRVVQVHEGLTSLRSFLQFDLVPQNEDKGLKDLNTQIINVIHYASYVTKLCPTISFSVWFGILCLPDVVHHIELLISEVKKIEYDLHVNSCNKLIGEIESSNTLLSQVPTSKHEGPIIGFRKDVKSLSHYLIGGQKDLTIISISGMPGQGKTTLAKRMYGDPSIQRHFDKLACCSVSKEYNIGKLLTDILGCESDNEDHGDNEDYGNTDIDDLANRLWKSLKGRRYFIFLDDIWDIDVWHLVQNSFPDDRNGSRILFTSRNDNLVYQCKQSSISHRLQLFSDDESWELMKGKLSYADGLTQELLEVGKQIAVYCRGLPLAVILMASVLNNTTQELDSWKNIKENLKFHLASEGCMHIIELSYKYLPNHLKPCFIYFGVAIQRGHTIYSAKVVRLWIAEGFVKVKGTCSSAHLGREYLDYLVSQNLVVVTRRGSTGKIKRCTVHDLIYDLCFQKAREYNILQMVGYKNVLNDPYHPIPQKYYFQKHWLCIHDSHPDAFINLTRDSAQKKLPTNSVHSLLFSAYARLSLRNDFLSLFLNNFGILTVLNMMDVNLSSSKFPQVILYNTYLRYLALCGSFSRVPPSISNLWRLETLLLFPVKRFVLLPESLWKMKSLSHVRIRNCFLKLDAYGKIVSSKMAASNIESLTGIILPNDDKVPKFLRSLLRLRKLYCSYDKGFCPKWLSMFESLEKLESLTIDEVIPKEFKFPKHNWSELELNFPIILKKLCLWHLGLPWTAMSKIGELPNLQVLKLCNNACKGATWDLKEGHFLQLIYLRLYWVDIKKINVSDCEYPFPCLEKLFVQFCTRLEEIPSSFGAISTLNTIHLISSPQASDSVKVIVEQQKEWGNDVRSIVSDHGIQGYYY